MLQAKRTMIGEAFEEQRVRPRRVSSAPTMEGVVGGEPTIGSLAWDAHHCVPVQWAHDTRVTHADFMHKRARPLTRHNNTVAGNWY